MVVPANPEALAKYKKWQNIEKGQREMDTNDYHPSSNLSPHVSKNSTTKVKKTWNSNPSDKPDQQDLAEYKKWATLTSFYDTSLQEMGTDDYLPFSLNLSPHDGNRRVGEWLGSQNEAKKSV
jgi:hypothetical protein